LPQDFLLILLSDLQGNGVKRSSFGVRSSKIKVTWCRS